MTPRAEDPRSLANRRVTLAMLLTERPRTPLGGSEAVDRLYLLAEGCRDMLGEAIWFLAGANRA
jgi:hypothetical protein